MNKHPQHLFVLSTLAGALISAFAPAQAQTVDEITLASKPQSQLRAGLMMVDRDNAHAGQYTGLHREGVYVNADLSLVSREDATGRWLRLTGRNLGLDSRELRFDHELQGQWRYFIDFSHTLHHEPLLANTRLSGFGTTTQNSTGLASARGVEFETKRETVGLGFDKNLGGGLGMQVRFRNDDKRGDRTYGFYGGPVPGKLFAAEPIDFTIQQWEATLNYVQDQLQLSSGYYGSAFHNQYSVLNAQGNGSSVVPQALPPDNNSHELFVAGAYQFSPVTRANFKASFGRATQDDRFFTNPTKAGNSRRSLDGQLDTTIVHLGLSSRPLPKLSIGATARYEERDDNTPAAAYVDSNNSRTGFNVTHSPKLFSARIEGTYQLPYAFKLAGGLEYDERQRTMPTIVTVRYRSETSETGYRLELRRGLGETLGGSVSYLYSERTGSSYVPTGLNNNSITDHIDPIHWGDRERNKWRVALDWTPLDNLSVQLAAEESSDEYPGGPLGRDTGTTYLYSADATYVISDSWEASAWFTQDDMRARQSQFGLPPTTTTAETWAANLRTLGNAVGMGVQGNLSAKVQIGAELQHARDRAEYRLESTVPSLPDIHYKRTVAKLYSTFAVQQNAGVRVDLSHERLSTDDWTWATTPVLFGDGTTLLLAPTQKVSFIGVSGYYKWW